MSSARRKGVLIAIIMVLTFLFGGVDVLLEDAPRPWNEVFLWTSIVLVSGLIFAWVHIDARERQYRRAKWLNVGVLALAIVFVPVYLVLTRRAGAKWRALAGFSVALAAYFGAGYAGSLLAFEYLS